MTTETGTLMEIRISRSQNGMFFATSEDAPTFFVSALDCDDILPAVRFALEDMFSDTNSNGVSAIPMESGDDEQRNWAIVPNTLIAPLADNRR